MNTNEELNSHTPVFDYKAVSNRLLDDKDLVITVAKVFVDDMAQQVSELVELVGSGDHQKIAIQAHKIKGSSANMGGMILSMRAKTIEMAGKEGNLDAIQDELSKLEQSFFHLRDEIQKVLF